MKNERISLAPTHRERARDQLLVRVPSLERILTENDSIYIIEILARALRYLDQSRVNSKARKPSYNGEVERAKSTLEGLSGLDKDVSDFISDTLEKNPNH